MDRKTLPCLQNASQHVPVYLLQFPSYLNYNCKKSPFLCTPAFIFCLPWGRCCGNHTKRCMNEKTIQCLPNPSQHVPIYLQQFPSYSIRKCKKFHVPQPSLQNLSIDYLKLICHLFSSTISVIVLVIRKWLC